MEKNKVIMVDREGRLKNGFKDAVFSRTCNKYKCELVPLNVEKHGVDKNKLIITGLAITHRPRPGIYIPKETFEKYGESLVGRPLADGHGDFPWVDIKVDEILGVVIEQWYDDEYEAQMFKAEVWDDNAIQVLKRGVYNKFSVAYYFEYEYDKIINEYDEEEDVIKVTELDYDHIAFLNKPQVPEAEIKNMEELSCKKPEYMDAMMFSGKNLDYLAKTYRHNSTIKADEPAWDYVDRSRLPWKAYANYSSLDKNKKRTWKYPHHWTSIVGNMFLHKGGLIYALAAAKGKDKKVPGEILKHLKSHIKAIKLSAEDVKGELEELGFEEKLCKEIIADLFQNTGGSDMSKKETEALAEDQTEETEVEEENQQTEETQETVEETQTEETQDETQQETEEETETESEEETEQETEEETTEEETQQLSNEDTSAVDKVAQMSVQINKKDEQIAALSKELESLKSEKLEKEIEDRVASLMKEGKILPAKKDETIALYKTLNKDQWENFEKIFEKNSAVPIGEEKGNMEQKESEKHSEERNGEDSFFN